ncbi:kinesin-like protein KIN-14C [Cryptomeria japonica]|uniref:kinesin-like protein KIN-14C n=1 Tax=Cryptomeria japonica TaxID=3369 RepID=UPI0025AC805E|nr:kinesin-like protein KIN-14C [Cryptomeria japonica]
MMMSDARQARIRQALSSSMCSLVNEDISVTSSSGHLEFAAPVEFCKENIDALLSMKMKGKTKFDHKGKCEQMAEYIKKLRACIRWFQELEENNFTEKEQLQKDLITEKTERKEIEDGMKEKEEELQTTIIEFRETCFSLQENLSKAECEREASIQARQKDLEARKVAEKAQACLSEERDKARQEAFSASQQVTSLQDINKRLQEYNTSLQQYNSKLQTDAATSAETISRMQKEKSTMMETLSSLRGHTAALQDQLSVTKVALQEAEKQRKAFSEEVECLRGQLQRTTDDRDHHVTQVQILSVEVKKYKECTGKSTAELEQLTNKTTYLQETFSSQSELISSLQYRLEIANKRAETAESSALQQKSQLAEQHQKIEELQSRLSEADIQIFEGELLRRKLHNTILELKGNIRVFCRVRPLLPDDECTSESLVVAYPTSTELLGRGIDLIQNPGQKHTFTFDKVFGHESKQGEVFVEISQLVQSALDGYKVCIFAYGQTGSGKTYTMLGKPDAPEHKGIIPRSLEQIFKTSQALSSQGWSFRMQASMLEIYNETIRDLLVTSKNGSLDGIRSEAKQYVIRHDQNGNSFVSDLTITDVNNWSEVSSLLHKAAQSRSVGKTAMNEQSSRSHCVFTLRISGVNESTEQQVHGVLNLIDLAGSERLSRSCSTGDRLKETQAINKSLACLGDVILAIANREQHVPYRNSKLTYLLQPCLGGDSKTLMFVNISPDSKSLNESLCSLRFAAKVNACEIGIPRRQTHMRASDGRFSYS